MTDILTRILPDRTWAMTQVGDIVDTYTGTHIVTDIRNKRGGGRTVILDGTTDVAAFDIDGNALGNVTLRRPLAKARPSGVKLSDRVSDKSLVNAMVVYKAVQ